MTVAVCGLSHHTSPLGLRERLAFAPDAVSQALHALRMRLPDGGAVILSTCNRVELYVRASMAACDLFSACRAFLAEWHQLDPEEFAPHLYEHAHDAAVSHLFRVVSSLDSMVVGEAQILGQVQDAFLAAQAAEATDKILNALFQRAFKVAKEVRTQTNIGAGRVSVPSVAVDLAMHIFGDLSKKTVMVVGSGETGQVTLKTLISRGVGKALLVNRNIERAQALARRHQGEALSLEEMPDHLARADIVISSTAAPEPILHVAHFQRALRERGQAPMFVADIAVPRDVEPAVNDLDNVYLYDLDALQQTADQNLEARRAEMALCLEIIEQRVEQFARWRLELRAEPTIVSITRELNVIRARELQKTLDALPELTEKERQEVEYLTKRIVNTILQRPLTELKREAGAEDPVRTFSVIRRLFGLKDEY